MSTEKSLLPGATRDLAVFASNLQYAAIPPAAVERIKLSVLDSIGCCIFGATLPWTRKVATLAKAEGAAPVASLAGMGEKTSIALAVLVNGTGGHAFELDDIHKESIVHAGSIATPIALAFAEQQGGAPGRDIITSMIAGYEVGHRVGSAATMSLFFRGFHPQGTSGTFVAAATAARALGLDAAHIQHALGICGSQAGGLMAAQHVGGLSGAFIPVSEDAGMIAAVMRGSLTLERLEAMTCVCSVGLDMIAIPGDTSAATISATSSALVLSSEICRERPYSAARARRSATVFPRWRMREYASHEHAKVSRFENSMSRSHSFLRVSWRPTVARLQLWKMCAASWTMKSAKGSSSTKYAGETKHVVSSFKPTIWGASSPSSSAPRLAR